MAGFYWTRKRWVRQIKAVGYVCLQILAPAALAFVGLAIWRPDMIVHLADLINSPPGSTGPCLIKGNISDDGERIYHMPGAYYYNYTVIDPTKGERWFCSEAEALAAGWRKSKL